MVGPVIGGVLYQVGQFRLPFIVLGPCLLLTFFTVLLLLPREKLEEDYDAPSTTKQML
jgi:MFS family permease